MSMQINQNASPFFTEKSTGRTCTICSERFCQKNLRMKYLILMARRQDDKGIKGFLIWDCGLWIWDVRCGIGEPEGRGKHSWQLSGVSGQIFVLGSKH